MKKLNCILIAGLVVLTGCSSNKANEQTMGETTIQEISTDAIDESNKDSNIQSGSEEITSEIVELTSKDDPLYKDLDYDKMTVTILSESKQYGDDGIYVSLFIQSETPMDEWSDYMFWQDINNDGKLTYKASVKDYIKDYIDGDIMLYPLAMYDKFEDRTYTWAKLAIDDVSSFDEAHLMWADGTEIKYDTDKEKAYQILADNHIYPTNGSEFTHYIFLNANTSKQNFEERIFGNNTLKIYSVDTYYCNAKYPENARVYCKDGSEVTADYFKADSLTWENELGEINLELHWNQDSGINWEELQNLISDLDCVKYTLDDGYEVTIPLTDNSEWENLYEKYK